MGRYDDLSMSLQASALPVRLSRLAEERISELRNANAGIPEEYIDFLAEIGYGSFGDGAYTLFGGLVEPDEIFDKKSAMRMQSLLFFGTDLMGYCTAFDRANAWWVVEIDPTDMRRRRLSPAFEQFIREQVLELIA